MTNEEISIHAQAALDVWEERGLSIDDVAHVAAFILVVLSPPKVVEAIATALGPDQETQRNN